MRTKRQQSSAVADSRAWREPVEQLGHDDGVLVFLHEYPVLSRGDHGACAKAPSVTAHADRLRLKTPPQRTRILVGADLRLAGVRQRV